MHRSLISFVVDPQQLRQTYRIVTAVGEGNLWGILAIHDAFSFLPDLFVRAQDIGKAIHASSMSFAIAQCQKLEIDVVPQFWWKLEELERRDPQAGGFQDIDVVLLRKVAWLLVTSPLGDEIAKRGAGEAAEVAARAHGRDGIAQSTWTTRWSAVFQFEKCSKSRRE